MQKPLFLFMNFTLAMFSTTAFADNLAQVYDQAKQNDPQLLKTKAERDAAFEKIDSARGSLLPQIDLTAGYNINRNLNAHGRTEELIAETNVFNAGLNLSQEIYNRASWISLDIAEKSARQQDSAYAAKQQELILRVAQAYFNVLESEENLTFIQAEKKAVSRQLEQTKQRFEVGLSAMTDVHDAQAEYDSVLANEIVAENELVNSKEELREITGQTYLSLDKLDTEKFSVSMPETPVNDFVKDAEDKNLTLLSARIAQDIAKDNISLAESGRLPRLSLGGGYQYTDMDRHDNNQDELNYTQNDYNIGLNLSMPIYHGGSISADINSAQYQYVAASEDLEAAYRGVIKNVRASYNNINASIGTIKAYEQAVVSAQSALNATQAGYEVGTRTIVDVLDTTRRLYDSNRQLATARYNYMISVLQLKQAIGSLSEQDILDINSGLYSN